MSMTNVSATLDQLVAETRWLRGLAVSLVKDQAAAEDLVHDTVLVAAERAPRDGRPLRPWLARVLLNLVRMNSRGDARRSKREQAVAELAVAPATPAAIVDQITLQRMLAGFVLELAQPLRDVVLLHYFEGLTSPVIANRLGLADSTVRWRLKQALDELRARLDRRAPNRAWVAPLAGFAGIGRPTGATGAGAIGAAAGVLAAFAVLAVVAVTLLASRVLPAPSASQPVNRLPVLTSASVTRAPAPTDRSGAAPVVAPDRVTPSPEHRRITGAVLDKQGVPVVGAELAIHCYYGILVPGARATARTGKNGTFAAEIDRECSATVTATAGDTMAWTAVRTEDLDEPVALALRPASVAVFKIVDAQTGAAIAGVQLQLSRMPGNVITEAGTTDSTGTARVRWDGDTSFVTISAPGYLSSTDILRHEDAASAPIERTMPMRRGIAVSGSVVAPDGRGVAGAEVRLDPMAGRGTTDASGAFTLAVRSAGRYEPRARTADLLQARNTAPVDVPAQGRSGIVIQLERRGQIRGIVVDDSGDPVAGARIRSVENVILPLVADAQGRFSLVLGPRESDVLHMTPAPKIFLIGYHGSLASAPTRIDAGERDDAEVTLRIGPTGISGVVVDLDGAPVPGADVWLNHCCGEDQVIEGQRVEADGNGRFTLDVPRGEYVLSVRRSQDDDFDERDDHTVSSGSHDVRLVLP